jgi:DNA polymerase-3 subunit delta'
LEGTKRDETTSLDFINEWRAFLKNDLYGNLSDWLMSINASDTNANINVAECNRIIKNLGLKSYEGKYKIQIIWNAESLAKEGNRLLKLIEEPSDDTIIILILNNQDAILNTIKSRCQILTVSPYSDDEIMAHLQSKFDLKSNELSEITYLSSGDIRKAEELAANKQMNFSEDMLNWFRLAYKADPEELLDWTLYLNSKGKGEIKTFMSYSLHFLREYLLGMNLNETENLRLSNEEKSVILKMKNIINRSKTERLEKVFSKNYGHINRNVSMKIMLMAMSLEINEILRSEVNKFVH